MRCFGRKRQRSVTGRRDAVTHGSDPQKERYTSVVSDVLSCFNGYGHRPLAADCVMTAFSAVRLRINPGAEDKLAKRIATSW